jgi:DNA-binding response OmpR family regulator
MAKILLCEDNVELAERIKEWFSSQNDLLEAVHTGEDALHLMSTFSYDAIILDWQLPGISGYEACKQFRANGGVTPVMFLTGMDTIDYKERGFDVGADDYLTKPFDLRELGMRVKSLLRRPRVMLGAELKFEDVELNSNTRALKSGEAIVHLLPKQAAVLEYLMRNPHRAFSSQALLSAVWPSDSGTGEETVRSCIKTLRKQLASIGRESLLKTVWGTGYLFGDDSNYR